MISEQLADALREWHDTKLIMAEGDKKSWVGFDLDCTLAHYSQWKNNIGRPIKPMIKKVQNFLARGICCKIYTARAHEATPAQLKKIEDWCEKHIGQKLEITNKKDRHCIRIYDDKAIQVEKNTGKVLGDEPDIDAEEVDRRYAHDPLHEDVKALSGANSIRIVGFTSSQKKDITSWLAEIPEKFLVHVSKVVADSSASVHHGKYLPDSEEVHLRPEIWTNDDKFGEGNTEVGQAEFAFKHEVGHGVFEALPEDKQEEWMSLSGWSKSKGPGQAPAYEEKRPDWPHTISTWTHSKKAEFVREYSKKNFREDFSDCFAYMMTHNEDEVPDAKREFIQSLIGDVKAGGPGSGRHKEIVEKAGGKYLSTTTKEEYGYDSVVFNDPKTGSTLMMKPEDVTEENVKEKLAEHRKKSELAAGGPGSGPHPGATVVRAPDFRDTGNHIVTIGPHSHTIYRDPESGWWYEDKPGVHFSQLVVGFNKKEAVQHLVDRHANASLEAGGPGSGRHPSFGKFKVGFKDSSNQFYQARGHSINVVKHPTEAGMVRVTETKYAKQAEGNFRQRIAQSTEHNRPKDVSQSFDKPVEELSSFLKDRYGLDDATSIKAGGPGSGCKPGDNCGRKPGGRTSLAKLTYKPATREKQLLADKMEQHVAEAVGGQRTKDNSAFDIFIGKKIALEIKTIMDNKNNRINMHVSSRIRKEGEIASKKLRAYTIGIDTRGAQPVYHLRSGVGAFSLSSMAKFDSIDALKARLK